ncbi:unnamed protein product [Boreogadus saida]
MLKGDVGRRPATDWPESVTKSRERHGNHAGNSHSSAAANMFHFFNFFNMPANNTDPAHVQEVLFAVENDPCCYRVESSRVESSYMCGGSMPLFFLRSDQRRAVQPGRSAVRAVQPGRSAVRASLVSCPSSALISIQERRAVA